MDVTGDDATAAQSLAKLGEQPTSTAIYFIDSAYQSANTVRAAGTSDDETVHTTTNVYTIPGTNVLAFDKSLDSKQLKHYLAILPALQAQLQAIVLENRHLHWHELALQPMVIGKNEQEASLHVIVFCSPSLEKGLTPAISMPSVGALLDLPSLGPRLGCIVIQESPMELNAHLDLEVYGQKDYVQSNRTYCGAPLILKHYHNTTTTPPRVRPARPLSVAL